MNSTGGVLYIISQWLDKIQSNRLKMLKISSELSQIQITDEKNSQADLEECLRCHVSAIVDLMIDIYLNVYFFIVV